MEDRLKDAIGAISLLGVLISIGAIILICADLQCNEIIFNDAIKKGLIWGVILVLSMIGINMTEKEEDIYDRL